MPELEKLPEENIYQAYGIYLLTSQHRIVRRLKKRYAPSIHGNKAWKSSFLLMDYFMHYPFRRGAEVIEIGCGWGPASVFCARRFKAHVLGIDLDRDVFPFLEMLAGLNEVEIETRQMDYAKIDRDLLSTKRILMGSDICFWDKLVDPLFRLITRALESGVQRIVITDPGRPTFYELADRCAKNFDRVTLRSWYAVEPNRATGEVLEVRG